MRADRLVAARALVSGLLLALALALFTPANPPASAATELLYVPATGHYVRGVFRDFWDKNGGLANFGYPITEEYFEPNTGRVIQYFERARFERQNLTATAVQLGLVGRETLGTRTFARVEPIASTAQRRYFSETGHVVQYGFKQIWETRGGLPVFGLPLSEEIQEQLADGQTYTVQYFERARFEFRPTLPAGSRVVLSDLGRSLAPRNLTAPLPPNSAPAGPISLVPTPAPTPASQPSLVRPIVPPGKNGRVTPLAGQPGQTFTLEASGFRAGEEIALWVTAPDGTVTPIEFRGQANEVGGLQNPRASFTPGAQARTGIWAVTGQGVASGHQAIGYFQLLGAPVGRAPQPGAGVPPNVNARVDPGAGPAGTVFFFDASGFRAGEEVRIEITASNGRKIDPGFGVTADPNGRIGYAGLYFPTLAGDPLGLYSFSAKGSASGNTATGYFVLTP